MQMQQCIYLIKFENGALPMIETTTPKQGREAAEISKKKKRAERMGRRTFGEKSPEANLKWNFKRVKKVCIGFELRLI